MKVLIIEDEKIASEKLRSMLLEIDPKIVVIAQLDSIKESVEFLLHNSVDLIFLDIQISDGISFSIFEQVEVKTPIIFTTAYDQYAIKAFQLNSIGYLLKPIRKQELQDCLQKLHELKNSFSIDFETLLAQIQGKEHLYKKRFLIQIGDKIKKIEIDEISYFYAWEKGVSLRTKKGNSYPLEYTLDKLETMIDPQLFFRINRKYLIHINSIVTMIAYSRGRVKLELDPVADDEFDTIVSVDRSAEFKKWLNS